jgi:hypothetical protein
MMVRHSCQAPPDKTKNRDFLNSASLVPLFLLDININMSVSQINKALPTLPAGWSADKDFKAIGKLSAAARRNVEPVGPYFLAHARRVRLFHQC